MYRRQVIRVAPLNSKSFKTNYLGEINGRPFETKTNNLPSREYDVCMPAIIHYCRRYINYTCFSYITKNIVIYVNGCGSSRVEESNTDVMPNQKTFL